MKKILVVDDERDIREILMEVLQDEGYEMLGARDGMAALQLLADSELDLLITDTMMPHLDGLGLIRAFRDRPEFRDTPVIVLSAGTRPDLDGLGRATFMPKPFDLTEFLDTVAESLTDPD